MRINFQFMIGERLEEGRKRKNVSIREAAEATKIRGDYLLAMEDNSFNIPLPGIYVRGFLKNYARYLNLDPDKILTDYDAVQLGQQQGRPVTAVRSSHSPQRESLGQMEIKSPEPVDEPAPVSDAPEADDDEPEVSFNLSPSQPDSSAGTTPPPPTLERESTRHDQEVLNENKTLYVKIGVVFAALILVGIILIVLIRLIGGGSQAAPELNPELATTETTPAVTPPAQPAQTDPAALVDEPLVISATDNVTLIIEQTLDRTRLFSGSLNAGETLSLEKRGPVSIRFTNGAAISIEVSGRTLTPSENGVGRTVVD
jgi:cytoskeleton protein RodZ